MFSIERWRNVNVCLWHKADQVALLVRGLKLGDKRTMSSFNGLSRAQSVCSANVVVKLRPSY